MLLDDDNIDEEDELLEDDYHELIPEQPQVIENLI